MKQKRAKSYRKQMEYYHLNFKFREPYQVLVDEEIILEAAKSKFDLVKGLQRTLQAPIKPMITQCSIQHLYKTKNSEAIELAKTFERRRCNHMAKDQPPKDQPPKDQPPKDQPQMDQPQKDQLKDSEGHVHDEGSKSKDSEQFKIKKIPQPISAFECISDVVNVKGQNKHRYVVATQKPKLRALFRRIPAVPLIYINRSVMILEPMSPVTLKLRNDIEHSKLSGGLNDLSAARGKPRGLVDEDDNTENAEPVRKKRKGPKEPNPLSVKKKVVRAKPEEGESERTELENGSPNTQNEPLKDTGDAPESIEGENSERKKRKRKHKRGDSEKVTPEEEKVTSEEEK